MQQPQTETRGKIKRANWVLMLLQILRSRHSPTQLPLHPDNFNTPRRGGALSETFLGSWAQLGASSMFFWTRATVGKTQVLILFSLVGNRKKWKILKKLDIQFIWNYTKVNSYNISWKDHALSSFPLFSLPREGKIIGFTYNLFVCGQISYS